MAMKFGSITSRRCPRCFSVGVTSGMCTKCQKILGVVGPSQITIPYPATPNKNG